MYILGLDSGGTKTKAVLVNSENFKLEGVSKSGPGNYHAVGREKAEKNLKESIKSLVDDKEYLEEEKVIAALGVGGLDTDEDRKIIEGFFEDLQNLDIKKIVNDVVISHYGQTAGSPGVTVVSGTGSIAYGINDSGEDLRVGGWGWLIGDEGSGFYAARKGLQKATQSRDGRGSKTLLEELAVEHFDLGDFDGLIPKIYEEFDRPHRISSFAKEVTKAAKEEDEIAKRIVNDSASELAKCVSAVKKNLDLESPVKVGVSGSFILNTVVLNSFKSEVKSKISDAVFLDPVKNPVVGAIALAALEEGLRIEKNDLLSLDDEIESLD